MRRAACIYIYMSIYIHVAGSCVCVLVLGSSWGATNTGLTADGLAQKQWSGLVHRKGT